MEAQNQLNQFSLDIQQQVISRSEIEGEEEFRENVFTQVMIEFLAESGELDDAEVCSHRAHGLQVNGYAISENDQCLDLLVTVYTGDVPPRTVTREEMTIAFKRLLTFFEKAVNNYHYSIEQSTSAFDLAQRISDIKETLTRVRFFLLTDGTVKSDPPKERDLVEIRASYHIWDIERSYRCWSSGRKRETIEINFEEAVGSPIPCLVQPVTDAEYATYLAVFPGKALIELYGRYGPRLLERNVRSFLQARGKINSGIRKTIRNEPHMFLAFNNGLSVTAEAIEIVDMPLGGKGIRWARDLQIVNGGQTTASIYHAAKRDRADVSSVFVQAKVTVLNDPSKMDDMVPKISAYANSQNKIQAADLEANNVYHRRIEELSRTIWAPAKDGAQRQTHWYYERARGQYQDELAREHTPARQRDFMTKHPKTQVFIKTDLAKFVLTWDQLPHIVSRGAQSCFSDFTSKLEIHVRNEGIVDETYYERLIAKSILFRTAERIMRVLGYPGYRANLVTYTLARLSHDTDGKLDLRRIWREQRVSQAMEEAIAEVSKHTWEHITHPPGNGNVTQYCKREDCWTSFLKHEFPYPRALWSELGITGISNRSNGSSKVDVEIDEKDKNIEAAMAVDSETWFRLVTWSQGQRLLNNLQRKLASDLAILAGYGKKPSSKQATEGMEILQIAEISGFQR